MLAFEIRLNGKKLCVGGIGEDGVLTAVVTSVVGNRGDDLFLDFSGLISRTEEYVDWMRVKPLRVGDKIQVAIADVNAADKPARRYRSDPTKKVINDKRYVRMMAKKTWLDNPDAPEKQKGEFNSRVVPESSTHDRPSPGVG